MSDDIKTFLSSELYAFKQEQADRDATFKFELANHIAETIRGQVTEAVKVTVNGKIDKMQAQNNLMQKQNDDIMTTLNPMAKAFELGSWTTKIVFTGAKVASGVLVFGAIVIGAINLVKEKNWEGLINLLIGK